MYVCGYVCLFLFATALRELPCPLPYVRQTTCKKQHTTAHECRHAIQVLGAGAYKLVLDTYMHFYTSACSKPEFKALRTDAKRRTTTLWRACLDLVAWMDVRPQLSVTQDPVHPEIVKAQDAPFIDWLHFNLVVQHGSCQHLCIQEPDWVPCSGSREAAHRTQGLGITYTRFVRSAPLLLRRT